jgi:hypothetical protein
MLSQNNLESEFEHLENNLFDYINYINSSVCIYIYICISIFLCIYTCVYECIHTPVLTLENWLAYVWLNYDEESRCDITIGDSQDYPPQIAIIIPL